ncbi:MAG: hypothetical protein KF873_14045 [Gemmataceae bacterium]|nr:hypothetical protein [Gemmataceae bacterium]
MTAPQPRRLLSLGRSAAEGAPMGEPVRLELTGDEALVLFEFLARFDEDGTLAIRDPAEERVLVRLQGVLEKALVEIFHPAYTELVEAARGRLRDPVG